jgi:hypothetical protein
LLFHSADSNGGLFLRDDWFYLAEFVVRFDVFAQVRADRFGLLQIGELLCRNAVVVVCGSAAFEFHGERIGIATVADLFYL